MMQVIYNSRLPVDDNDGGQGYFIDIKCGSDQDDECGISVLAATNPKPGETTVSQDAMILYFPKSSHHLKEQKN